MARTTPTEVEQIIETSANFPIKPHIDAANTLVDWIANQCVEGAAMTEAQLGQVEKWLAAHFYACRDAQFQSKSTGGASATFQGETAMNLSSTWWGQQAMLLDISGCLAGRNAEVETGGKKVARIHWLGKTKPNQTDYKDRN